MDSSEENQGKEKDYIIVSNGNICASGYLSVHQAEEDAMNFAKEEPNEWCEVYQKVFSVRASLKFDKTHYQ